MVAFADYNRSAGAAIRPGRVQNEAVGKSAAECPVIVEEKTRLLEADEICLLEQRLDISNNVMSASEAVRRVRVL